MRFTQGTSQRRARICNLCARRSNESARRLAYAALSTINVHVYMCLVALCTHTRKMIYGKFTTFARSLSPTDGFIVRVRPRAKRAL